MHFHQKFWTLCHLAIVFPLWGSGVTWDGLVDHLLSKGILTNLVEVFGVILESRGRWPKNGTCVVCVFFELRQAFALLARKYLVP